jgi:DNA-binding NarL/FixJ family response regulator
MSSALNHKPGFPDRILVIDDLPIIPLAFREIFRSINSSVIVEYSENIFSALSSLTFTNTRFDLVIAGSLQDDFPGNLQQTVTDLKKKFGEPKIMVYSSAYDPSIIGHMAETGIDAYVHRFESIEEIRKTYCQLAKEGSYVSEIFHTLYYEYGEGLGK